MEGFQRELERFRKGFGTVFRAASSSESHENQRLVLMAGRAWNGWNG
jgi:hypothetical protein